MAGRVVTLFLMLSLWPAAAAAAAAAAQELRVYVVTIGPGELAYERFGHNALLFADAATGERTAYDWGRFDFDQPGFFSRFARGEMLYSSGVADGNELLAFYSHTQNRRVILQELQLAPDQASALLRACEIGHRPENRDYRYDYFTANCSTKLRDAVDDVLDGQLAAQLRGTPAGTTYRREAERHMAPDWPLWFAFHGGFGRPAERPIDAWEQSFLPGELRDWLNAVEVTDASGESMPLVAREIVLNDGDGAPVAAAPPSRWWQTGLFGLLLGGAMLLLSRLRRPAPARLAAALWFFLAGIGGTLVLGIWAFTGHWSGYANQTALLVSPLGLALAITTPLPRFRAVTVWLAAMHLALCLLGILLHVVPGLGQENAAVVALALPANAAAAWVAGVRPGRRLAGRGNEATNVHAVAPPSLIKPAS